MGLSWPRTFAIIEVWSESASTTHRELLDAFWESMLELGHTRHPPRLRRMRRETLWQSPSHSPASRSTSSDSSLPSSIIPRARNINFCSSRSDFSRKTTRNARKWTTSAPNSANSASARKPSATGRRRRNGRSLSNWIAGFIPPVKMNFATATYQPVASFMPPCCCRNQATIRAILQHAWRTPEHFARVFPDKVWVPVFYREPYLRVSQPLRPVRSCIR